MYDYDQLPNGAYEIFDCETGEAILSVQEFSDVYDAIKALDWTRVHS